MPEQAAGRRRARGGHQRGVQTVHVEGDIEAAGKVRGQGLFRQALAEEDVGIVVQDIVLAAHFHFFAAEVAHGELGQRQAQVGHGPVHDAGVGIDGAFILGTQVRMGIELHHAKGLARAGGLGGQCTQGAQAHGMLAAQDDGQGLAA